MSSGKERVGFIGLGAMGGGMAGALLKSGFDVCGYDIFEPAVKNLESSGGKGARTCEDAAAGAAALVVMVTTAKQADSVLFGENGAIPALPDGAVVILCSTVPPDYSRSLSTRLSALSRNLSLIDAPVSGGVVRAAEGTLTIMASGAPDALEKGRKVLEAMSANLYIVGSEAGPGSAVKMVNQLLAGVHIAAAAEAMAIGARAGLDTRVLYNIIRTAAGNSWMFENRVPHMLDDDYTPKSALNIFVKDLGIVLGEAQGMAFPTPLAAAAHQQFLAGASAGLGRQDDAAVVKVYEKLAGIRVAAPLPSGTGTPSTPAEAGNTETTGTQAQAIVEQKSKEEVLSALPPEWSTPGEVAPVPTAHNSGAPGGAAPVPTKQNNGTPGEAAPVPTASSSDSQLETVATAHGAQTKDSQGVIQFWSPMFGLLEGRRIATVGKSLPTGSQSSAVLPAPTGVRDSVSKYITDMIEADDRLPKKDGDKSQVVDGKHAALPEGSDVIILGKGAMISENPDESAGKCMLLLDKENKSSSAFTPRGNIAFCNTYFYWPGGDITGCVLIKNAIVEYRSNWGEKLEFKDGERTWEGTYGESYISLGIGEKQFDWLRNTCAKGARGMAIDWGNYTTGSGYIWFNAKPKFKMGKFTFSTKVGGILKEIPNSVEVLEQMEQVIGHAVINLLFRRMPVKADHYELVLRPSINLWSFQMVKKTETKSPGVGVSTGSVAVEEETASAIVTRWGQMGGVAKPMVVVLDDDPTGTQTVHDIQVLTKWDVPTLVGEMQLNPEGFFILTNSRALPVDKARALTEEICANVQAAAREAGLLGPAEEEKSREADAKSREADTGSREAESKSREAGTKSNSYRGISIILRGDSTLRGHFPAEMEAVTKVMGTFDAWLICPFFLEGGRYTIDNVHYVADGDILVPAGQTEFARDQAFGYSASDLRQWVAEKSGGSMSAADVASVSLDTIRKGGPVAVADQLSSLPKGTVCIINAASNSDLQVVAEGILQAELKGSRFLCRTAASFVSASLGIQPKPPLGPNDFPPTSTGGLIVVGSYVPKTTAQASCLLESLGSSLHTITVDAERASRGLAEEELSVIASEAEQSIQRGIDTVILTSRTLITAPDADTSLAMGQNISDALVGIVRKINTRPKYILAKGGITSSDVATKGLSVGKATVAGQAMPGVPLWSLGPDSRFPKLPYIVFPGNVGGPDALASIVKKWQSAESKGSVASKTHSILKDADKYGYAVGAFNIYNLEGVRAIVRGAEAENSPAIIQIHPAALKVGGAPLVAACVAAASEAQVPVSLHLDHGVDTDAILAALDQGFHSVMVDGSHLDFDANIEMTRRVVQAAHAKGVMVEAELGRIAGIEDGVSVADLEARMTGVSQAEEFLVATGVDALAVCVGNRHGPYPQEQLQSASGILDMPRIKSLQEVASRHGAVLVLHGASGLPTDIVQECTRLGIRKYNVNTEVRKAGLKALHDAEAAEKDLSDLLKHAEDSMVGVIRGKMRDFGSSGMAIIKKE